MLDREELDAVSIAVPTSQHCTVALDVIGRGVSLLIEKPLAASSIAAVEVLERATEAGVIVAVGHVERFNPAVIELQRQLAIGTVGTVLEIKARRTGPFPMRVKDVGVVVDLATHDIDLMLKLTGANVERVYAATKRNINTLHEDMLLALLHFDDGTVGSLDINWLTPEKVRDLTVLGTHGMCVVDYLRQQLYFYENGTTADGWDHLNILKGVTEGRMIRMVTQRVEPLQAEMVAFANSVRAKTQPEVTGRDGLQALVVAEALLASARASSVVSPCQVQQSMLAAAAR
jgi:predicted dehydrogenase